MGAHTHVSPTTGSRCDPCDDLIKSHNFFGTRDRGQEGALYSIKKIATRIEHDGAGA